MGFCVPGLHPKHCNRLSRVSLDIFLEILHDPRELQVDKSDIVESAFENVAFGIRDNFYHNYASNIVRLHILGSA